MGSVTGARSTFRMIFGRTERVLRTCWGVASIVLVRVSFHQTCPILDINVLKVGRHLICWKLCRWRSSGVQNVPICIKCPLWRPPSKYPKSFTSCFAVLFLVAGHMSSFGRYQTEIRRSLQTYWVGRYGQSVHCSEDKCIRRLGF